MSSLFQGLTQDAKVRAVLVSALEAPNHYFRGVPFDAQGNAFLTFDETGKRPHQGFNVALNGAIICATSGVIDHWSNATPFDVNGFMQVSNAETSYVHQGCPFDVNGLVVIAAGITQWTPNFNGTNSYGQLLNAWQPTGAEWDVQITFFADAPSANGMLYDGRTGDIAASRLVSLTNNTIELFDLASGSTLTGDTSPGYYVFKLSDFPAYNIIGAIEYIGASYLAGVYFDGQIHNIKLTDQLDGVVNGRDVVEQNGTNSYGTIPAWAPTGDNFKIEFDMLPRAINSVCTSQIATFTGYIQIGADGKLESNVGSGFLKSTDVIPLNTVSRVIVSHDGVNQTMNVDGNITSLASTVGAWFMDGIGVFGTTQNFLDGFIANLSLTDLDDSTNSRFYPMDTLALTDSIEPVQPELVVNGDFASDSDWTKDAAWTISSGNASCDGAQVGNANIFQSASYVVGKAYFVSYEVLDYSAGDVKVVFGDTGGVVRAANGVYTETFTFVSGTNLFIQGNSDFTGSIDNISVKETTTGEWINSPDLVYRDNNSIEIDTVIRSATMPTETGLYNKLQPALGQDVAVNGTFDTGLLNWTLLNATWVSGRAFIDASGGSGYIFQTHEPSTQYEVTFDLEISGGSMNIEAWGGDIGGTFSTSGTYTVIINTELVDPRVVFGRTTGSSPQFYIDNVVIKQTNKVGDLINLGAQAYVPKLVGGEIDGSYVAGKFQAYNGDYTTAGFVLGVYTAVKQMIRNQTSGSVGSWAGEIDLADILISKTGEAVKVDLIFSANQIRYTTLLGTDAMIQSGFEYPNVFRVLEPDADINSEYYYYDNGGLYPWTP